MYIKRFEPKGKEVLLIGNSPNVLNYEIGEEINKSDFVICRFNFGAPPPNKYIKQVGNRTDYRIMNGARGYKNLINSRYKMPIDGKIIIAEPHHTPIFKKLVRWFNDSKTNIIKKKKWNNKVLLEDVCRKYINKNIFVSSGILAICHLLEHYSKIYIHGFSFDKNHFWEKRKYKSHHNWKVERIFVEKMVKEGRIVLLKKHFNIK